MQSKLLFCLCVLLIAVLIHDAIPAEEIRVIGGVNNDYKDADGRIWYSGQKEKQTGAVGLRCYHGQQPMLL